MVDQEAERIGFADWLVGVGVLQVEEMAIQVNFLSLVDVLVFVANVVQH